jgi:hypothetical protein
MIATVYSKSVIKYLKAVDRYPGHLAKPFNGGINVKCIVACLQTIKPCIEIVNIPPKVTIFKLNRLHGTFNFETFYRPATMDGGFGLCQHPLLERYDVQSSLAHSGLRPFGIQDRKTFLPDINKRGRQG